MKKTMLIERIKDRYSIRDFISIILSLHFIFVFFNRDSFFGLGNSYIFYTIIFILSLILIIKEKKFLKFNMTSILCIFIIIYSFIVYLLLGGDRDILFAGFLFFSIIFCISNIDFNINQQKIIVYGYIISSVILSLILILQMKSPYESELRYTVFYSLKEFYDVNFLSTYLSIPTVLLFMLVYEKKISKYYFFVFLINIFAIFLTGSRAGIFVTVSYLLFYLIGTKKINIRQLIFIIVFSIIIFFIFIPKEILARLTEGILFSLNSRRGQDWIEGIKVFLSSPILGNGLYATNTLITEFTGKYWLTAHNSYIAFLIYYGIIGFIPLMYLIIEPFKNLFRRINRKKFLIAILYSGFLIQIAFIEAGLSDIVLRVIIIFYITSMNQYSFWEYI